MNTEFARTLLTIDWRYFEDASNPDGDLLDMHIASWNPRTTIQRPLTFIPIELREHAVAGTSFIVRINTGVEDECDLRFEDFELAPPPMDLTLFE
jgi:hypothetical protein